MKAGDLLRSRAGELCAVIHVTPGGKIAYVVSEGRHTKLTLRNNNEWVVVGFPSSTGECGRYCISTVFDKVSPTVEIWRPPHSIMD